MNRLEASRAKIQRAKEHFQGLLATYVQFMNLNPYGVVIENDPEARTRIWRVRVSRPVPADWSLIAGDIVHNLRASLDFLAFQLWDTNGRQAASEDSIYFRVTWVNDTAKIVATQQRVERELGAAAMAVWDRLQPYKTGDAYESHPLYVLHHLDIWDKHRLLNLAVYAVESQQGFIGGPGENVHIEHMAVLPHGIHGPLADGAELHSLTLGADTPNVQVEINYTLHVTFEQGGPGKGKALHKTLDELISFTDEAITKFAPLLA